jgi:hypothetical protein
MDYQYHGSHLFRAFADVKSYPSLTIYGLIVFKKKPECYPERSCRNPQKKKKKQAFAANARKGKGKFQKKNTGPSRKKKDLSKIQCYICDEFGHYARDCPQRKRKERQHASIADEHPQKKTKCDDDYFY